MTALMIVFAIVVLVTLFAAIQVVTDQNMVHAALWLIVALLGVAATFVLLNAPFLAVVQVMVYIGAIAILMIFAIMLTRKLMQDTDVQLNKNWPLAAILAILFYGGMLFIVVNSGAVSIFQPEMATDTESVRQLGQALVSPNAYILPFELASVLLLAGLIGAIYVAWKEK